MAQCRCGKIRRSSIHCHNSDHATTSADWLSLGWPAMAWWNGRFTYTLHWYSQMGPSTCNNHVCFTLEMGFQCMSCTTSLCSIHHHEDDGTFLDWHTNCNPSVTIEIFHTCFVVMLFHRLWNHFQKGFFSLSWNIDLYGCQWVHIITMRRIDHLFSACLMCLCTVQCNQHGL